VVPQLEPERRARLCIDLLGCLADSSPVQAPNPVGRVAHFKTEGRLAPCHPAGRALFLCLVRSLWHMANRAVLTFWRCPAPAEPAKPAPSKAARAASIGKRLAARIYCLLSPIGLANAYDPFPPKEALACCCLCGLPRSVACDPLAGGAMASQCRGIGRSHAS
jgi:hypothetical protein